MALGALSLLALWLPRPRAPPRALLPLLLPPLLLLLLLLPTTRTACASRMRP